MVLSSKKLLDRFLALDSMPKSLSPEDARRRGHRFESLVLDLFEKHGMLRRRSYHTTDGRSEQIDGAIRFDGRLALIEAKWVKSQLAASELFAFTGKVDGKFTGTIGVFISRKKLSDNFLTALRTGRRQTVLVMHGKDIDEIFQDNFPLKDYLETSLEATSIDNIGHLSAVDFLSSRATLPTSPAHSASKGISTDIDAALMDSEFGYISHEVARDISDQDVDDTLNEIINLYKNQVKQGKLDQNYAGNLVLLAKELKPRLSSKGLEADWNLFNSFSKGFINSPLRPFGEIFSDRVRFLGKNELEMFSERLFMQWNGILGDYDKENDMAQITQPLWDYLDKNVRMKLLKIYISFVVSSRVSRYPQVRLAEECIKNATHKELRDAVYGFLHENVKSWVDDDIDDYADNKVKQRLVEWQVREYGKISKIVNIDLDVAKVVTAFIDEILDAKKHAVNRVSK